MDSPLETVEYLARSNHRIEVLDAIRSAPRSREEIRELTDASRVTAGRIITDLEERGWIVRHGQEYEATTSGRFVAREFTELLGNIDAFSELPPVVEWYPEGEPSFDLYRLADATVTKSGEADVIAPIHRALELIGEADRLVAVGNGASREFMSALREAVEAGQTTTLIGPPGLVDALRRDPDQRADTRAIVESDRAELMCYEGDTDVPVLQVGEDWVALCSGDHRAMVESDDAAVHDWATAYVDRIRAASTAVPAEAFRGEPPRSETEAVVE